MLGSGPKQKIETIELLGGEEVALHPMFVIGTHRIPLNKSSLTSPWHGQHTQSYLVISGLIRSTLLIMLNYTVATSKL